MRFIDILREAEEEEGVGSARAKYDVAIQTANTDEVISALDNIENYGVYAQSLRDPEAIKKAFGPSIPTQRPAAAFKDWDNRSEETKRFKLIDIEKRAPEDYRNAIEDAKDGFEEWEAEGNDGDIIDYLLSLSGKELPKDLIGKQKSANGLGLGRVYFPLKTPDNLKKYGGRLEQGIHFYIKDNNIVFPFDKSPYSSKPYLQKVLNAIMDKAGVKYKLVDIERLDDEDSKTIEKPKKTSEEVIAFADTLDQIEKIRSKFKEEIGDVKSAKYETEPVKKDGKRRYKLTVTGISYDQKVKLIIKKGDLKEGMEFDLDLYLMQKRAGL